MPPRVKFSTRIEGAFTPWLNSRSSATVKFLNISFKFPAIVTSDTGYERFPFSIQNPEAPLL